MGFFSTILGFCGFGVGISIGLVAGYFLFIYFQPTDVKVPLFLYLSECFLCMYGHVHREIFVLVCIVLSRWLLLLVGVIVFFFVFVFDALLG